MMSKYLICFAFISASLTAEELPEPYASIVDLPFDPHGWFGNQVPIERLMEDCSPRVVIEVGSWLGLSTRFIAERLPEGGKLYAVDTWKGSLNETVHQKDARLPRLYQLFLSNIKHAGLAHKIVPVRMDSLEAAEGLAVSADMIYLDAAHDTASVLSDIEHWLPHLNEGGLFCGDDWSWNSVRVAVLKSAEKYRKTVHSEGNFWWFEP